MKVIAYDIETGSADEMFSADYDYIRLCGWAEVDTVTGETGEVRISTDPAELLEALNGARGITHFNGLDFDNMVMAVHAGADYEDLCRKSYDLMIVERHLNPVAAKGSQPRGYYGLDATAARYGAPGKTDDVKKLARKFGGFHLIPQDNPEFIDYLIGDVQATAGLFLAMLEAESRMSDRDRAYIRREHAVQAALGRVTINGFRVDADLTMKRWAEGQRRLEDGRKLLSEKYGMPEGGRFPHRTNPGKAAFRAALIGTGISESALEANWPTGKDGSLLTGKEVLTGMIEVFDRDRGGKPVNQEAADLCRTILALNGERSTPSTILDHMVSGRVHPTIRPEQSSGRWSMSKPGLTVMGKRDGKATERAMLLADEGELLVAIDADQVDGRVIAAMCQDPEYMKLFQPGMDLHSEVAFRVWPDQPQHGDACHRSGDTGCDCGVTAKCHCTKRDQAKVFGHGFSYGLGANGMAKQHGVDVAVAQSFVRGMTEAFPRLAEWKEEVRAEAGALGYDELPPEGDTYRILHTWAGRPVRVERTRAYTQATALLGQGGTRDVMAQAMLNLPVEYRKRIKAVIHDEFVFSLPRDGAEVLAARIADAMAFDLNGIRITFGGSRVARTWAGCYGAQYEAA